MSSLLLTNTPLDLTITVSVSRPGGDSPYVRRHCQEHYSAANFENGAGGHLSLPWPAAHRSRVEPVRLQLDAQGERTASGCSVGSGLGSVNRRLCHGAGLFDSIGRAG